MLALLMGCLLSPLSAWAKDDYQDIYLTHDRICKACTAHVLPRTDAQSPELVELTNRTGESGVYPRADIIGVDDHPILRKLFLKSVAGVGLPGRIIVPYAFADYKEYTCKYCDPKLD